MGFLLKFLGRIILNGAALWLARKYFPGFMMAAGEEALVAGALVLALLNTFVRPILRLVTLPLRWITLGLFNIVINIAILALADYLLPQLTIQGFPTLFWTSLIVALANAFF